MCFLSVLFLYLGIGLGWATTVSWYIVRLAPYHRGYFEARGGLFLLGLIFSFLLSIGEGKGTGEARWSVKGA
jgi:hypothetical protein